MGRPMPPPLQSANYRIDETPDDPLWDALVAKSPGAHYEQSTAWARVKLQSSWQAYRILVHHEGRLVGGAQVLHRRVRRIVSIAYIARGPVACSAELTGLVSAQVLAALKKTAHTYLVILPNYEGHNVVPILTANGYVPKPEELPPSKLVTATMVIDLTQDLDAILARMKTNTRRDIRIGARHGLTFGEGGAADVETFHQLMCQLCARRGTTPHPATAEAFHEIWKTMAPTDQVKLFLVRRGSEVVSAAFAFVFGQSLKVWKVGWSGQHKECLPNQTLWWELIKWAKAAGLRQFDFVQILPDHARALLKGEKLDDPYWGVTQFKANFGGDILLLPDAHYRSYHSLGQLLLRCGGSKLLASARVQQWLGRFTT